MSRASFQVLVLPFLKHRNEIRFAIFRRQDLHIWQAIAGGGEDGETPLEAVQREWCEEAGIPQDSEYIPLDTITSIPVTCFDDQGLWDPALYVIPEYSFGVEVHSIHFRISHEHTDYQWCSYHDAHSHLHYDSNKTALWELHQRIRKKGPRDD
jgi:dATP pyrophosphohydrolase